MMKKNIKLNELDIVLYHKGCQDGITSAYILKYKCLKIHNEIETIGISFNGDEVDLNKMKDKQIIIVDILPKNIELIKNVSKKLYVLDHHVSSQKKAEKLDYCYFNMNLSGCGLAFEYAFGNVEMPKFIKCVQTRDLWTWNEPNAEDFTTGLFESSYAFMDFIELFEDINFKKFDKIKDIGKIFNTKKANTMKYYLSQSIIEDIKIKNYSNKTYKIIKYNCPNDLKSDFGNYCMKNADIDFCVLWTFDHKINKYIYSLRSTNEKEDTSIIATFFNGGGHRNASGFEHFEHPNILFC
jgi:oligoribonuclease NrnB/cAMP/cGMP phosphodiesterase (DHH superfamily)